MADPARRLLVARRSCGIPKLKRYSTYGTNKLLLMQWVHWCTDYDRFRLNFRSRNYEFGVRYGRW
jgi:hypothetical protein